MKKKQNIGEMQEKHFCYNCKYYKEGETNNYDDVYCTKPLLANKLNGAKFYCNNIDRNLNGHCEYFKPNFMFKVKKLFKIKN